jgi:hypothetical protein
VLLRRRRRQPGADVESPTATEGDERDGETERTASVEQG